MSGLHKLTLDLLKAVATTLVLYVGVNFWSVFDNISIRVYIDYSMIIKFTDCKLATCGDLGLIDLGVPKSRVPDSMLQTFVCREVVK